MIDVDFRAYLAGLGLVTDANVPGAIQQDSVDQNGPADFIWFHRRSSTRDINLDGGKRGFTETSFDLELISDDISLAQAWAENVKEVLDGYRGEMGDSFVLGAFVEDHADDYVPIGGADEGKHVCSLDIQLIHT